MPESLGCTQMTFTGNEYLAHWLELQISKSGLTYDQLCDRTGYSATSIDRWFSGQHLPKLPNLIGLCEVFAVAQERSPRQLVFESLMHCSEMVHAEYRWKRKMHAKQAEQK